MNGSGSSLVIPSVMCLVGFATGGLLALGAPAVGFGWGAVIGAITGGGLGKAVQTALRG